MDSIYLLTQTTTTTTTYMSFLVHFYCFRKESCNDKLGRCNFPKQLSSSSPLIASHLEIWSNRGVSVKPSFPSICKTLSDDSCESRVHAVCHLLWRAVKRLSFLLCSSNQITIVIVFTCITLPTPSRKNDRFVTWRHSSSHLKPHDTQLVLPHAWKSHIVKRDK